MDHRQWWQRGIAMKQGRKNYENRILAIKKAVLLFT